MANDLNGKPHFWLLLVSRTSGGITEEDVWHTDKGAIRKFKSLSAAEKTGERAISEWGYDTYFVFAPAWEE